MDFRCPGCGFDDLWGDGWGGCGEKVVRCEKCGGRWLRDGGQPVSEEPTTDTSTQTVEETPDQPPLKVVQPRPRDEIVRDVLLLRNAALRLLVKEVAHDSMTVSARDYEFALDLGHYSPGRLIAAAHRCIHSEYRTSWSFELQNWYWHASPRSDLYRSRSETAILGRWQQDRLAHALTEFSDDDLWVPLRRIGVREHATPEQALLQAPSGYSDGMPPLPPGRPPSVPLSQSGGYYPGSVPAEEHWPGRR